MRVVGEGSTTGRGQGRDNMTCRRQRHLVTSRRVALTLLLVATAIASAGAAPSEAELRAAFVYNFTKFIEWPGGSFASPEAPLRVCVVGEDAAMTESVRLLEGRATQGRNIQTVTIGSGPAGAGCHVIYLASRRSSDAERLIDQTQGQAVLTVGDGGEFINRGGMIGLINVNGRLQFEVNLQAVNQSRLKLSSQLLRLARNVATRPEGDGR